MYLKAMELHEEGTKEWAESAASAFDMLKIPQCCDAPKPEWWNDEGLKALSARVVALTPDDDYACSMRASVLAGGIVWEAPWNAGPRTAAEIKEAASWNHRAARVAGLPVDEWRFEQLAQDCDAFADLLLVNEEAEAAKVRAAAEVEAAEAMNEGGRGQPRRLRQPRSCSPRRSRRSSMPSPRPARRRPRARRGSAEIQYYEYAGKAEVCRNSRGAEWRHDGRRAGCSISASPTVSHRRPPLSPSSMRPTTGGGHCTATAFASAGARPRGSAGSRAGAAGTHQHSGSGSPTLALA